MRSGLSPSWSASGGLGEVALTISANISSTIIEGRNHCSTLIRPTGSASVSSSMAHHNLHYTNTAPSVPCTDRIASLQYSCYLAVRISYPRWFTKYRYVSTVLMSYLHILTVIFSRCVSGHLNLPIRGAQPTRVVAYQQYLHSSSLDMSRSHSHYNARSVHHNLHQFSLGT